MPKVVRTPVRSGTEQQGLPAAAVDRENEKSNGGTSEAEREGSRDRQKGSPDVAALLMAMEARLSSKLHSNKKAVNEAVKQLQLNSDALDALEEKVDNTDDMLKEALARVEAQEERVLARVEAQVKEMVREQLKAAGFDSQLSAGDLPTIRTADSQDQMSMQAVFYASAAGKGVATQHVMPASKEERQELKFWEARDLCGSGRSRMSPGRESRPSSKTSWPWTGTFLRTT